MKKNMATLLAFTAVFFTSGCKTNDKTKVEKEVTATNIYYTNLFGERYLAQGALRKDQTQKTETGLWQYTNLDSPFVLFGNYLNGLPVGNWNFTLKDGTVLTSEWSMYKNKLTSCTFSMPFKYVETQVNSSSFKLTSINDSLGKITIIIQVSKNVETEDSIAEFGRKAENALYEKGYEFKSTKRNVAKDKNKYFFTEYFLSDSLNQSSKLYYLYGNSLSQSKFVEFTLFHDGPKEDLVKIIYNLMVASFYIDDKRFFNPYEN